MDWLNIYGLVIVIIVMIPNIVYAVKTVKNEKTARWIAPRIEQMEQIGRYGCIAFMIFNVPKLCTGFWFEGALTVYITVNAILLITYCVIWVIVFDKVNIFKSLALSIIPSAIFLFSGIVCGSVLLIASAMIFAVCHILISYKNTFFQLMASADDENNKQN